MLQKIKKSYLIDFFFFLTLSLGLWALYRSRAFLLSKILTRISGKELEIKHVSIYKLTSVALSDIKGKGIYIDTLVVSVSPLELIRFRLNSIYIKKLYLSIDSLNTPKQVNIPTQKAKKPIRIPALPIFLSKFIVQDANIISNNDTLRIENTKVDFKGTTKNFVAKFLIEDAHYRDFELSFFKGTFYRIGKTFRFTSGQLCSNVFCIENIKAAYDSLLTLTLEGTSFTSTDVYVDSTQITWDIESYHAHLYMQGLEIKDRVIDDISILIRRDRKNSFKFSFTSNSDWLTTEGYVRIRKKSRDYFYSMSINKLNYMEKDAFLKGKLFLKGKNYNASGILRLTEAFLNDYDVGKTTVFFKEKNLSTLIVDSAYINNNRSSTFFSGIVTKDSQFLYLEPSVFLQDYDSSLSGYIQGYVAAIHLSKGNIYINSRLYVKGVHTPYGNVKKASILTYTTGEDSTKVQLQVQGIDAKNDIKADSLSVDATIENLEKISFKAYILQDTNWLHLTGEGFRGEREYTMNLDTVWGILRGMELHSESPILLTFKNNVFYISTGNLYAGRGILKVQGTFSKEGDINAYLITRSLNLPFSEWIHANISTNTEITGNISSPILFSEGILMNPEIQDIESDSIVYSLSFVNNILRIENLAIIKDRGTLTAQGSLIFKSNFYPPDPDSIISDLVLNFENFDVTFLLSYIDEVFNMEYSEVNGNIGIKGQVKHPFFTGALKIQGSNGYMPAIGLRMDRLSAYLQFGGNRILLKSLHAESDAGEITAFGNIYSHKYLFDSPDITIYAKSTYLEIGSEIQALCDGKLHLKSGKNTPLLIEGDVNVKEGYLFAEFSSPKSLTREETNPELAIKLHISWKDNVYLINEFAEIEFDGNLTYKYDKTGTLINGKLNVLGGNFSYFEHLFKVSEGSVTFNNLSIIDPELNITAITDVDSYSISLNISGTLTEPIVNLSSEPPLDESNILALLTFGKLLNEQEANIFTASMLEKKALGFAQSYLLRSLRRRLGLRELEVSTGSIEEDPHLTVGFYVTRDLYLKYYHDFLSIQYDRFDLRYRISRYFGLSAIRDDEGKYYFGLFFEKRF